MLIELSHQASCSVTEILSLALCVLVFICSLLYTFPMAAVTNYHIFSGLNKTNSFFYSSGGQKSKAHFTGLKLRCRQGRTRGEKLFLAISSCKSCLTPPPGLMAFHPPSQPSVPLLPLLLLMAVFSSVSAPLLLPSHEDTS